jgi:putative nucleotidyltransferase with HDIG domain
MQELDAFIEKVKHLPPAPRVLPQLMQLLSSDDSDATRVVQLIQYDPGLAANVLRASNTTAFAASRRIADLGEAIFRLGFNTVFQLVVAVGAARSLRPAQKGYGMGEGDLWQHSVTSGVAARLLARMTGQDENLCFTAGLLHDLGKVVLSQVLEEKSADLIKHVEEQGVSIMEAEKKVLGFNHAELGARLLERWNFPASITVAVRFHHMPGAAEPHHRLAAVVYLANFISYSLGHGYGHSAFSFRSQDSVFMLLGIDPKMLDKLIVLTRDEFETIEALFQIRA